MSQSSEVTGVLFVCMGNICRSPLAEGVFCHLAEKAGVASSFNIDSCGTGGWHVGSRPDRRSSEVAVSHGIELAGRARQIDPGTDFDAFDLLIAMDSSNMSDIIDLGCARDRVRLMRSFDPAFGGDAAAPDVPDPYYGGEDGFEDVFEMVRAACEGLLATLTADRS